MKLRAKILALIAAMMGILYLLVAGALIPELTAGRILAQQEFGQAAAHALQALLEELPREKRLQELIEHRERIGSQTVLNHWAVADSEGRVVAESRDDEGGAPVYDLELPLSPDRENGRPWKLLASSPSADFSTGRELWSVFVVMLAGTLMMGVAVYSMVLRLVVKPVERLAAASRAAVQGHGILPRVPQSDRADELGELMRAYNAMVTEVNELRLNLEKRVAETVHELQGAQKRLILSERLSVTGKLAAGIAHEINNPLGGMLNAARSLQQKAPTGTRDAEYLDMIVEGLGRVQGIVSKMLQFARPTAQRTSVDLAEVMEDALLFCQHRVGALQVLLTRAFPEKGQAPIKATGNRAELGQVFLNLILNALDALESKSTGERRLELALRYEANQAFVRVADSGPGMSPQVYSQAGEMFFSTKTEGRGTGLGLAMARHIVEDHGGSLDIESQEGQGTTILVRLPKETHP